MNTSWMVFTQAIVQVLIRLFSNICANLKINNGICFNVQYVTNLFFRLFEKKTKTLRRLSICISSHCNTEKWWFALQYAFFLPADTRCVVQMPRWLSWASTSNPNPSFNLKNCSLCCYHKGLRRGMSHLLLIDCSISLHSALLRSACLAPSARPSSNPFPRLPPSPPPRPERHAGWPVSDQWPFCFSTVNTQRGGSLQRSS